MKGLEAYRQTVINTTDPAGLVVLLYRRLSGLLGLAAEAAGSGNWDRAQPLILKAQEVVAELWAAVDLEAGPVAHNLFSIYDFIYRALAEAYVRRDGSRLLHLKEQVEGLGSAWEEVTRRASGV